MFYSKKLKKFNNIKHCFFSRKSGFSKGIYKGLNCGAGSNDSKKNIIKNLNYVSKVFSVRRNNLILMNQTHSNRVIEIKNNNNRENIRADAIVTKIKGLALGVVTADCVPIIIYDYNNKIVGCIHAGWKGAISGIIKNTVDKIRKLNTNNNIFAAIGPCIGKSSYEVDLSFYKKFLARSKKNNKYFSDKNKNKNKKLFNLRKFVSDKLIDLKVKIDHVDHDTYKEKSSFFSYRRSCKLKQSDYGRCISVVSLV
jgi:polyphenol oxidase